MHTSPLSPEGLDCLCSSSQQRTPRFSWGLPASSCCIRKERERRSHHSSYIASESQHRKGMQSPNWDSVWGNVEGRRDPLTFFEIRELVYLCTQCEEIPGTSVPAWHQTAFRQIWPCQNHQDPSGRPRLKSHLHPSLQMLRSKRATLLLVAICERIRAGIPAETVRLR